MGWPPQRSSVLLVVAAVSLAFWMGATLVGAHPDGAILGFSGAMFGVWGTTEKEARRRSERHSRSDEEEDEERDHLKRKRRRGDGKAEQS